MDTQAITPWQGFHHIALVTPDLDATIGFYREVLEMQIGDIYAAGVGVGGRHCFIRPGSVETWGLHVFENRDPDLKIVLETARQMSMKALETGSRLGFFKGVLQHIAFALPDEQAALDLRERLQKHQVLMTPINAIGTLRNFLFLDNNGLLLEATWPEA